MAARKKRNQARTKASSKAGLWVLLGLALLAGALASVVLLNREEPLKSIPAEVVGSFGEAGMAPGQLQSPRGVAVDSRGQIYVVDLGNSRIDKYAADGTFLKFWGKPGENPPKAKAGEFNEPSGISVGPAGDVYVADAWNGRIQKFSSDGKFEAEFGGSSYSFYSPRNVATDRSGNFYVADTGNSMVKVYSPDGVLLKAVGERGRGAGKFEEVFGLAINSKGEVYAADPGNQRINHFSALPEMRFLGQKKVLGWKKQTPFWPQLSVDAADRVYALDAANRQIWVYDPQLKYLGTVGGQPGQEYFSSPLSLGFQPDGTLVVVDKDKNSLVKLKALDFSRVK